VEERVNMGVLMGRPRAIRGKSRTPLPFSGSGLIMGEFTPRGDGKLVVNQGVSVVWLVFFQKRARHLAHIETIFDRERHRAGLFVSDKLDRGPSN